MASQTISPDARSVTTLAQRSWPRFAALRWIAGVYFVILGMSLLLLPQGSLWPWLGNRSLRGATTILAGLVTLWLMSGTRVRRRTITLQAIVLVPQVLLAAEYIALSVYSAAATLLLFTAGTFFAALAPEASEDAQSADALGLVLGGVQLTTGLDFIPRPTAAVIIPPGIGMTAPTIGAIFAVLGLAVITTQLVRATPRWLFWLAHLSSGGTVLALQGAIAAVLDPIYWLLGAATMVRGVATMLLPWWSGYAARLDRHALRVRLGLALVTATIVPLMIVLPATLAVVDRQALDQAVSRNQEWARRAAADAAALPVADRAARLALIAADTADDWTSVLLLDDRGGATIVPGTPPLEPDVAQLAQAALASSVGGSQLIMTRLGPQYLSVAQIGAGQARLGLVLPEREVLAQTTRARQLAFAIALVTGAAAALCGWWLAGQFAAPLRALVRAVGAVALGKPLTEIAPTRMTELAMISVSVHELAQTLAAQTAEREQLIAQLQAQNDELRTLERQREDHLRAISHDLRNPLTALIGNGQRLVGC